MRKRVIYVVLVLVLLVGTVSYAAESESFTAYISDIKLFLNGNQLEKDIVVIDGSSFLPVRDISEALGLEVNWEEDERTIELFDNVNDLDVLEEKNKLLSEVSRLQEEISDLEAELYLNQETLTDDVIELTYNDYEYDSFSAYLDYWDESTPFSVNGYVYNEDVLGIDESGRKFISFYNFDYEYKSVKLVIGIDDSVDDLDDLTVRILGNNFGTYKINEEGDAVGWNVEISEEEFDNLDDMNFYVKELDISNYELIKIIIEGTAPVLFFNPIVE